MPTVNNKLEKLEVLPNRCLVKVTKEEKKGEVTESGIYIPSTARIQYSTKLREAEVVLVSSEEEELKVGDIILIEGSGVKITYEGMECININCDPIDGQVMCKI